VQFQSNAVSGPRSARFLPPPGHRDGVASRGTTRGREQQFSIVLRKKPL